MKNESTLKNSKPVFSGHETFPLRYGWLKKVYDAATAVEEKKEIFPRTYSIILRQFRSSALVKHGFINALLGSLYRHFSCE